MKKIGHLTLLPLKFKSSVRVCCDGFSFNRLHNILNYSPSKHTLNKASRPTLV